MPLKTVGARVVSGTKSYWPSALHISNRPRSGSGCEDEGGGGVSSFMIYMSARTQLKIMHDIYMSPDFVVGFTTSAP